MDTLFLVSAGLGGSVLVCQFLAGVMGLTGDHDVDHGTDTDTDHDHDHSGNWFLGVMTFRSVTAAVAFFGLGGLSARYYELPTPAVISAATFAAIVSLFLVAWVMRMFQNLRHDGTARLSNALNATGTVYLRIPANKTGAGKVTLTIQNRTVECEAMTQYPQDLPTGSTVRVVDILGPTSVEVEPIE